MSNNIRKDPPGTPRDKKSCISQIYYTSRKFVQNCAHHEKKCFDSKSYFLVKIWLEHHAPSPPRRAIGGRGWRTRNFDNNVFLCKCRNLSVNTQNCRKHLCARNLSGVDRHFCKILQIFCKFSSKNDHFSSVFAEEFLETGGYFQVKNDENPRTIYGYCSTFWGSFFDHQNSKKLTKKYVFLPPNFSKFSKKIIKKHVVGPRRPDVHKVRKKVTIFLTTIFFDFRFSRLYLGGRQNSEISENTSCTTCPAKFRNFDPCAQIITDKF